MTKVIQHKVTLEGKKDRVRMEVQFNRLEKLIIFLWGLIITLVNIESNPGAVTGNPVVIAIVSCILLAFFVLLTWYIATLAVMLFARATGTVIKEGF